jgi:hypothetical protein
LGQNGLFPYKIRAIFQHSELLRGIKWIFPIKYQHKVGQEFYNIMLILFHTRKFELKAPVQGMMWGSAYDELNLLSLVLVTLVPAHGSSITLQQQQQPSVNNNNQAF